MDKNEKNLLNLMANLLYNVLPDQHDRNRLASAAYDAGAQSPRVHEQRMEASVLPTEVARLKYENEHLSKANAILRQINDGLSKHNLELNEQRISINKWFRYVLSVHTDHARVKHACESALLGRPAPQTEQPLKSRTPWWDGK